MISFRNEPAFLFLETITESQLTHIHIVVPESSCLGRTRSPCTVSAVLHHSCVSRSSPVEIIENTVMLKNTLAIGSYSYAIAYYLKDRCGLDYLRHSISMFLNSQYYVDLIRTHGDFMALCLPNRLMLLVRRCQHPLLRSRSLAYSKLGRFV